MTKPERIGVLGGTFDPIHKAHLELARTALLEAALDRVVFVVAGRPPHKTGDVHASPEHRLKMAQAAIAADPPLNVSDIEITRDGPSYMADTLELLQKQYPNARLYLIMGMDSLVDLPNWREPERILKYARILAAQRPGNHVSIPASLEGHYELLPFDQVNISSTQTRQRIAHNEDVSDVLPEAVIKLIQQEHIYGD